LSDEKLTDLEIRIAFLEDNVQTLDQVIQELGSTLDAVRRELRDLQEAQSGKGSGSEGELSANERMLNEKPPHY
jgi:uncharacterized coiled-coil protein SlyX